MLNESLVSVSNRSLFREMQELFEYIGKEKNTQLGMINLFKGFETKHQNTKAKNELASAITSLTSELKNSINSQNSIQANLNEVVKTISSTYIPIQREIPNMCNKEVSCDGIDFEDLETESIPIVECRKWLTPYDDKCTESQQDTCCEQVAPRDSAEDLKLKWRKSKLLKNDCSSTLRNDFNEISRPNIYILSVVNFCMVMSKEVEEWSEPFYTSHIGYRMCVKLGFSCRQIGIYIKLVKGDFDDLLAWPFQNEISFTLINQIDEEETITRVLKPHPYDCDEYGYWIKPELVNSCLGGWGLRDFVDNCTILGPNEDFISDFIRNDRIYIKVKILE